MHENPLRTAKNPQPEHVIGKTKTFTNTLTTSSFYKHYIGWLKSVVFTYNLICLGNIYLNFQKSLLLFLVLESDNIENTKNMFCAGDGISAYSFWRFLFTRIGIYVEE